MRAARRIAGEPKTPARQPVPRSARGQPLLAGRTRGTELRLRPPRLVDDQVDSAPMAPDGSDSRPRAARPSPGKAARSTERWAAMRRLFVELRETTTHLLTVCARQPRSAAMRSASLVLRSSVPTSSFTSMMAVLSSMTRSEPVAGWSGSRSMMPRSPKMETRPPGRRASRGSGRKRLRRPRRGVNGLSLIHI